MHIEQLYSKILLLPNTTTTIWLYAFFFSAENYQQKNKKFVYVYLDGMHIEQSRKLNY